MSASVKISQDLYDKARSIAEAHHITVEQVFESACADQFAAWHRLQQRAARGDRQNFLDVLENVSKAELEEDDRL